MNTLSIEKIYNIQYGVSYSINKYENHTFNYIILFFFLFTISVMYFNIIISLDVTSWDIKKCKPKYLFISGFIKKIPGFNAIDSTMQNFWNCMITYIPINYSPVNFIKNKKEETKNKIKKSRSLILNDIKGKINKDNDSTIRIYKKINNYKNIDLVKVDNILTQHYLIMKYMREYLNNILTYLLSKIIIKHKKIEKSAKLIEIENDLSGNQLTNYRNSVDASLNFYKGNADLLNKIIKDNLGGNKL